MEEVLQKTEKEVSEKSRLTLALLAWFLGWLGIDRFYIRKIGTAILKLITLGGLGIWWLIDFIIAVVGKARDKEGKLVKEWRAELFRESWRIYRAKIKTLVGIMLVLYGIGFGIGIIFLVISITGGFLMGFAGFTPPTILMVILALLAFLLITPSLIYAIKEDIGIKASLKKGLKMLPSFILVAFLTGLITLGGYMFLIVPGILFSIWFSLANYVLIFEEKKGMSALLRSKDLIAGNWWSVFWKFLTLWLVLWWISSVAAFVVSIIAFIFVFVLLLVVFFLFLGATRNIESMGPIIGLIQPIVNVISAPVKAVIQFFVTPFALIYGILIYQNLKDIKKEAPCQEPSKKRKIKYILIGISGILLFIGLMVALMLYLLLSR